MSWIDDFNSAPDMGVISKYQPPTPSQPQSKKRARGGFLSSLISEGGALGGGALGASIGSGILPGVGTLLGGALGAGIGAFTGRVAENKVRDNRLGIGDAAKEGALSTVLGSSPIKLGKAAFAAKKGGIGLAEALKMGAPRLEQGATKAIAPARTSISGKLDELANKTLTSQYGTISKPVARATNPEKTFSTLAGLGITKPSDAERISNAITGTNGILNKAVVKTTGDSNRVDVSGLRQVLTDAMENNGVVDSKAKELTTMFDAQMKRLLGGPKGGLSDTAHPSDVLDVMKAFEKRIAQKSGKGGNYRLATDETTNQANALRLVTDELQSRLESGADVKNVLTPDLRKKLVSLHPNNESWQKYVDNNIMKSGDIKSLRSAQSPFVNASKIINEADLNSMTFGGRVGDNANLSLREALTNAVIAPFKGPATRAAASTLKTASNLTKKLPLSLSSPAMAAIPTGIKIGAKSQVGEGLASALMRGQSSISSRDSTDLTPPTTDLNSARMNPNTATDAMSVQPNPNMNQAITTNPMNSSMINTSYTQNGNLSNDPFDVANVSANIRKILTSGGKTKDVQDYIGLVTAIQSLNSKSGNGLSSAVATQLASSENAVNTLNQLEGLFGTAGGGGGQLGGKLKNALANAGLNGNVQTYNDLTASSVSQLARALNGGGQVSDADAAVVIKALPKITDSPQVAASKFAALKARLAAAKQNALYYNGAPDAAAE